MLRKRSDYETRRRRRRVVAYLALFLSLGMLGLSLIQTVDLAYAQAVRPPETVVEPAPVGDEAPPRGSLGARGGSSDSDLWRMVREGDRFTVTIPDKKAAFLVQSEGDEWRAIRNGPLPTYGSWAMAGFIIVIALFYLVRGRIRIDAGRADATIERFNGLERFGHWLLATSFLVLALTGLNILYGRYVLLPVIGPEAFSAITIAGKWAHNNIAWAFMLGLVLVFFMWVGHNIPNVRDIGWLLRGGGLLTKGVHLDARKFNAGQKIVFWATIIGGVSLSLSGVALLFPFETDMMGKTFAIINVLGFDLQTNLTPMQEMQYQTLWHAIVAIGMICIIIAHIYIGSLGMEGAFAAMGNGQVDLNWAKEHHNLWVAEVESGKPEKIDTGRASATPAE